MAQKVDTKTNKVRLYYDSRGNTLNVWFDNPQNEYISEETGDEVVLNKNSNGKVIGFEKLNYFPSGKTTKSLPVEIMVS
ncbi:DUF2283 domain-containing protein [Patescibacteria group bacterium]|nr:DUF2283 domain-containing protein [Patescibacteria group bacterium]MBU1519715.1 DUF2283 domain-containing protein [Patescibacteria group bacterium]MBU2416613.1 DUF2283 domain-containing protein [Patescibacteria group bacterium]MBU2460932.1 DUF2283 domain-containing protein [Patescibacteria group bacterium]